jgi:ribosomal protein S18 acetylase RimI-like enzyme
MTALLLPIPYPKKFFEETVEDPVTSSICLIALWSQPSGGIQQNQNQKVVSGIRCRLLARSPALPQVKNQEDIYDESPSLYVAALTTLAPYRGHGLASALFRRILSRAIREYGITTVTAHRWEANEEARGWYASHGFKEVGFAHDYYRRLKPSGAFLLERKVGPQDLLGDDEEGDGNIL